jgi:REP element-mobilizing transposase RayT
MSSRRAPWFSGEYYHVYNEGCDSRVIFMDLRDYAFFLERLHYYAEKFQVKLVAWCLMPTHYHFLAHQCGAAAAGRVAQFTCNAYSKYFNRRHGRRGTLFASSYKVKHAHSRNYFLHLFRYIHANPVLAGLVERPEEWPWSNFYEYTNDREWKKLDARFRSVLHDAHEYAGFVEQHILRARGLPENSRRLLFIGRGNRPPDGLLRVA